MVDHRDAESVSEHSDKKGAQGGSSPTCPVCGTACSGPPLHRYTAERAAAHFCPPTRDADRYERFRKCIVRLWGGKDNAVHECAKCGFGFAWPHMGGDEEFYKIMHEMAGYPAWRWDYDVANEQVLAKLPGGSVLDIGTGDGAFLKRLGSGWKTCAIEGSDTMRDYLRSHNIACFDDLDHAVRERAGSFDVVTMFQVLEHIAEFDQFLGACRKLLKPEGSLVIGVPLAAAMFIQEEVTGFADMTPNHPNKWTPKSLELALRKAGLQPQSTFFQPGSWRLAVYRAFLRVKGRAVTHPRSLSATVYRIPKRQLRLPFLGVLTIGSMMRCLPRLGQLRIGHSFAMVATKPSSGPQPATGADAS